MGVLVAGIVLTAWEAAVWLGLLSARYFPPPTAIAASHAARTMQGTRTPIARA